MWPIQSRGGGLSKKTDMTNLAGARRNEFLPEMVPHLNNDSFLFPHPGNFEWKFLEAVLAEAFLSSSAVK